MFIIHFYDLTVTTVLARFCCCQLLILYQQKRPITLIKWIFNHGFFLIGDQNLSLHVEWFNKKLDSTYFPVAIITKIVIAKCREMINLHFVAYVCIFVIFLLFAFLRFKDNTYKTKSHLLPLEIPIEIWEKIF